MTKKIDNASRNEPRILEAHELDAVNGGLFGKATLDPLPTSTDRRDIGCGTMAGLGRILGGWLAPR